MDRQLKRQARGSYIAEENMTHAGRRGDVHTHGQQGGAEGRGERLGQLQSPFSPSKRRRAAREPLPQVCTWLANAHALMYSYAQSSQHCL